MAVKTSNLDTFLQVVGVGACCVGVGFTILTIIMVWANNSTLNDLRDRFSNANFQMTQSRVESTERRIQTLEQAYNKEHPDAKLNSPGIIYFSNGVSQ